MGMDARRGRSWDQPGRAGVHRAGVHRARVWQPADPSVVTGSLTGPTERAIPRKTGQSILLHGANGGVGGTLIQLSHLTGVYQIDTTLPENQASPPLRAVSRWTTTIHSRVGGDVRCVSHARFDGHSGLPSLREGRIGCLEGEEVFPDPRHSSPPSASLLIGRLSKSDQMSHLVWIKEDL